MVKDAMSAVPYGDRAAMVAAIMDAIRKGGLFSVDVDIIPTKIGQASHVWLPAATSGEMNLTSMNGERRMRLTERYMDPPGRAMPDCLIAARIANHMERVFREQGKADDRRPLQGLRLEDRRRRLHGRLPQAREGRRVRHLRAPSRDGHQRLPGAGGRHRGRTCRAGQLAGPDHDGPAARHGRPGPAIEGARGKEPVQQAGARRSGGACPHRRDRAHHRHQAPLRRRQVQHQGRQGRLHGDEVARPAGRRARRRNRRSSRSSSTTVARTTSGRAPISTSRTSS